MRAYTIESSNAFVETFIKKPYKKGILSGLTFSVKDIIDVSGHITGCGNPSWRKSQKKAISNAFCVDQLLENGATCIGKTHTDEFAFSLLGENYFYGTPINPSAPDRVPGGSSSGSASSVACGLVDFSLGTDTGGSIRIPASNCGIWGLRPTHGRISVAGVHPFAPTFDTVGLLSSSYDVLSKTAQVLLGESDLNKKEKYTFFLLEDAFNICDENIKNIFLNSLDNRCNFESISFSSIFDNEIKIDFDMLYRIYCKIQWMEIWNTHGSIIEYKKPQLGAHTKKNFNITKDFDRSIIQDAVVTREIFSRKINKFLDRKVLLFPTSPTLPPLKGSIGKDRRKGDYYPRTLGLTSIAGLGRLPQVSIPLSTLNTIPVGLSLITSSNNDGMLLSAAKYFNN